MADEDVLVEVRHPESGDHRVDVLDVKFTAEPPGHTRSCPPDGLRLSVGEVSERRHVSPRLDEHVSQRPDGSMRYREQGVLVNEGPD